MYYRWRHIHDITKIIKFFYKNELLITINDVSYTSIYIYIFNLNTNSKSLDLFRFNIWYYVHN